MDQNSRNLAGYYSTPAGSITVSSEAVRYATQKQRQDSEAGRPQLLSFPVTRSILWDRRPLDSPTILHLTHYRNPSLNVEEKTLRLAHRFAQDSSTDTYTCYLLASVNVNSDGEGISVNVDRFESKQSVVETCQSTYSIVIPCLVKKNSAKPKISSQDFGESIQAVSKRCKSKSKVNLGEFISMYAYCSYHENQQNFIFHVDFTMITSGVKFKLTPVSSVPVVPTALSKNLAGPLSMSGVQGEPKSGYLTMDQTRKLLLVLESDPKVSSLPLVGIWISGVSNTHDPFVWACCLRYLFNPALEERVVTPPEAFLVLLYTPIHSKPEFYECVTVNGSLAMCFGLSTGHEVIQMPKNCLGRAQSPLEVELLSVQSGEKKELFEAALENNRLILDEHGVDNSNGKKRTIIDDITPRSMPAPHLTRTPVVQPLVPEVSLLLDENEGNFDPRPAPQPLRMTHMPMFKQPSTKTNNKASTKSKKKSQNNKGNIAYGYSASQPNSPMVNGWPGSFKSSSLPNSPDVPLSHHYGASLGQICPPPTRVIPPESYMAHSQYPNPIRTGQYPVYEGNMVHPTAVYNTMPSSNQYGNYMNNAPYLQTYNNNQHPVIQPQAMYPQQMPPNIYNPHGPQGLPWNINGYPQVLDRNVIIPVAEQTQGVPSSSGAQQNSSNLVESVNGNVIIPGNIGSTQDYQQQKSNTVPVGAPVTQNRGPPLPTDINVTKQQGKIDYEQTHLKQVMLSPLNSSRSNPTSADNSPHHESSSDSGLHISDTPDPEGLFNNTLDSIKTSASSSLNHKQVPQDVYELLKVQDSQLKMLREQLSQLLAKQNEGQLNTTHRDAPYELHSDRVDIAPPPSLQSRTSRDIATQSSNQATPKKIKPQISANSSLHEKNVNGYSKDSVAVNTSLVYPEAERMRRDIIANNSLNLTVQDVSIHAGSIDHVGIGSPVKNKPKVIGEMDRNNFSTDTISFGELQLTGIQDRTEESMMSEMIVDMPAYGSISPEKQSSSVCTEDSINRSPQLGESVSMYERQNFADMEDNTVDTGFGDGQPQVSLLYRNHKQFYQNLMGNIQKFLEKTDSSDGQCDNTRTSCSPPPSALNDQVVQSAVKLTIPPELHRSNSVPESMKQNVGDTKKQQEEEDVGVRTLKELQALGVEIEKLSESEKSRIDQTLCILDPVVLPKISYVSMMLDGDSDISAEADALAMKYLTDEQLTELAKLRLNSPAKSRQNNGLDGILHNTMSNSANKSNVTLYGSPSNHMSFASKKYLERYGLLDSSSDNVKNQLKDQSSSDNTLTETTSMKSEVLNVKEFLKKLSEKSFVENVPLPNLNSTQDANNISGRVDHSSFHNCSASCGQNCGDQQSFDKVCEYKSESFHLHRKPTSTPMESDLQKKSKLHGFDMTYQNTPFSQKQMQSQAQLSNNPAANFKHKQLMANEHIIKQTGNRNHPLSSPTNQTNNDFKPENLQKFTHLAGVQNPVHAEQEAPLVKSNVTRSNNPKSVDNVLDIERLRELPKLL